ncbi:MAG: sensor histidine kinase, partial [Candidatus Tyrphobacter sp.]
TIASLLDDCGLEKPPKAIVLRSSVFNASDLFAAQVSSAGGVAKARDITVIYQPTESDMPGAFCGDSLRITQIVQNLVLNAIHHAPRGGHVDVHAKCSPEEITFIVHDNGAGIETADTRKIFERGFRNAGNLDAGSGLGLSIVRQLVRAMHGDVGVFSEPGRGATFTVRIPAAAI